MADVGIAELFAAVEVGNDVKVKELIGKGISPNSFKDESHITPLHYCTQVGDVQMFKLLLKNKASLRKRDRWMDSVVHYACRYGNIYILKLILEENSRQLNKMQLKQKALLKRESRGFRTSLDDKCKVKKGKPNLLNLKGKACRLPISEAIVNMHMLFVVGLFNAGAAIDIRDHNGNAPIDLVLDLPSELQNEIFNKLMTLDAKVVLGNKFLLAICKYGGLLCNQKIQNKIYEILENFPQSDKERWLEIFLEHDCVEVVKKLLAEPNYYTWKVVQSVLKKAVEYNHEEVVTLVLNEQAGISVDNDCIILSIKNQSVGILKYLLKFAPKLQSWEEYDKKHIINVALETGNVDVVSVLFEQFPNPLVYVVREELWVRLIENKSEELIKYLLNAGVKVDETQRLYHHFKTPLIAAIESKNKSLLKCIITAGYESRDPQYALQVAIKTQNIEIVKLALTLPGSNLNDQKLTKTAILTKNFSLLENLLSLGMKLSSPDFKDWSALMAAVETKELNMVELVYTLGARFSNSKDEIWKAVENSSEEILVFLLRRCSIDKLRSKSAWTPLHEAVMQDSLEIMKLLVKNMQPKEINISGTKEGNHKYETPLSLAVLRNNFEITKYLITIGANIHKGGRNLYNAVVSGSEEIVTLLLRAGISTYLDAKFSLTILHVAVIIGNVNIVKQLLQLKTVNINAEADLSLTIEHHFKRKYGCLYIGDIDYEKIKSETTPIQIAVRQNSEDIALELLNLDVDITIPNKMGRLPWVEALVCSSNVLLKIMLLEYKSRNLEIDINSFCELDYNTRNLHTRSTSLSNSNIGTPLHFAVSSGNLEGVNILLEYGASASKVNSIGETAIFGLTLLMNDKNFVYQGVNILIKNGTDINHFNAAGSTVLNEAVKHGNNELVNVLILEGADVNSIKDETFDILLKSGSAGSEKYVCREMNIVHLFLQHGYNFQDISKVGDWLFSTAGDPYSGKFNNWSKEQHMICEILDHMRSLDFDVKTKAAKLLLTAAKYDLQILGKYLLSAGCDVNVSKRIYAYREENALQVALEHCNFQFMTNMLDAGAEFNGRNLINRVLEKASAISESRQYHGYSVDKMNLEDSFLCEDRYESNITSVINVFDTILKQSIDFDEVLAPDDFLESPVSLSIAKHLPWAIEYFVQNKTVRNKLHSDALFVRELCDLLLQKFHISTAQLLVDNFGTSLVQSNQTIVHQLLCLYRKRYDSTIYSYRDCRYVTEEEVIGLTQRLIDKGLDINSQDDNGYTVLHHAAVSNAVNVVKFVVEKQCDVMCTTNESYTALELAIRNGNFQCSDVLLACTYPNEIKPSKAESLILNVIKDDRKGIENHLKRSFLNKLIKFVTSPSLYENLLQTAVSKNDSLTVKMLLGDRYKIYGENEKQMRLVFGLNLINSSKGHFVEIMEELIDAGAELKFEKRASPLHYMCCLQNGHVCTERCLRMLKILIKRGSLINMEDEVGKLPLHNAIVYLNYEAATLLVKAGSLISPYGSDGASPVGLYLSKIIDRYMVTKQIERVTLITQLLLKTGKALIGNIVPPEVIYDVIVHSREEVLFLLSKYTTHLEYRDSDGNTGLHVACRSATCKILAMLLDMKCEVNAQNKDGITSLFLACKHRKYEFVKLLVKHGAEPDIPDNNGITPIHMCILEELPEALVLLLSKKCDVNKKTKGKYQVIEEGSTPLVTALTMNRYKSAEIAEKLVEVGADVDICNEEGDAPLHIAIRNGCKEALLQNLINRIVNIDIQNNKGWTALHIAITNEDQNIVELILKKNCDINARICDHSEEYPGYTALHIAVHHTNESLVEMLLKHGGSMYVKDVNGKTSMDLSEINQGLTEKLSLWPMLIKAGGNVRSLVVKIDLLTILQKSNLLDLLIESGCTIQFEGQDLLEPEGSLLEELANKQQYPLSLMRLAANIVRTSTHPNALYGSTRLPLPERIQRFICFDDSNHDVNLEVIQSFSQQDEGHSNVLMQYLVGQMLGNQLMGLNFGPVPYYFESDSDDDDRYYQTYTGYDSDDYYYGSD